MTTQHDPQFAGLHTGLGLLAGLTGAALADRLLTVLLGVLSSLTMFVATELLRPYLQRRRSRDSAPAELPDAVDDDPSAD